MGIIGPIVLRENIAYTRCIQLVSCQLCILKPVFSLQIHVFTRACRCNRPENITDKSIDKCLPYLCCLIAIFLSPLLAMTCRQSRTYFGCISQYAALCVEKHFLNSQCCSCQSFRKLQLFINDEMCIKIFALLQIKCDKQTIFRD